jgi:hypothetical protein
MVLSTGTYEKEHNIIIGTDTVFSYRDFIRIYKGVRKKNRPGEKHSNRLFYLYMNAAFTSGYSFLFHYNPCYNPMDFFRGQLVEMDKGWGHFL